MKNPVYKIKNLSLSIWNDTILLYVPDGGAGTRIFLDYTQSIDLVRVLTILNTEIKPKGRKRRVVKSKTE